MTCCQLALVDLIAKLYKIRALEFSLNEKFEFVWVRQFELRGAIFPLFFVFNLKKSSI